MHSRTRAPGEGLLPADVSLTLSHGSETVVLRPERPEDADFLAALFRDIALRELERMPIDDAMKESLVRMQFASQTATYRQQYPAARFDIVERHGVPIGRIVIDPGTDVGCIVDFALIRECRAHGLGSAILGAVLDRFAELRRRVLCKVLADNVASLRMCRRAGFVQIGDMPPLVQLEWRPALRSGSAPSDATRNGSD